MKSTKDSPANGFDPIYHLLQDDSPVHDIWKQRPAIYDLSGQFIPIREKKWDFFGTKIT
jgi:hypothetical protein